MANLYTLILPSTQLRDSATVQVPSLDTEGETIIIFITTVSLNSN